MTQTLSLTRDEEIVAGLRAGDERTFDAVVRAWSPAMLRLATSIVGSRAVAEEVLQETWLAVFNSVGRFEARASLKTWVYRILANTAKTRALREHRSAPFSALVEEGVEPTVAPDRFLGPDSRYPGHWASIPDRWHEQPEEQLASSETMDVVAHAIDALPSGQRAVISLRDVVGWSSQEVCDALGLSEVNQRVLLHRARASLRRALEEQLGRSR